uniref:Protein kinase domain-containing protein n=1 Tax=Panagrolaimus davidi TaxID=227884 RepID=A0A914PFD3_9BILA
MESHIKLYIFNYNILWGINTPGKPYNNKTDDLYNSALFSIGQMLGLNNSKDKKSIMYDEFEPPTDSEGNYIEKTLSPEDIKNLQNQPKTFTIFEDEYQQGTSYNFVLYDNDECHELTRFNDIASSINTNGHCIELYEDSFCEAKSVIIKLGCTDLSCCSSHSFVKCKFNDLASSYRRCENTGINIAIWISVVISSLAIGFLMVGIVLPWMHESLKVLIKKMKNKRFGNSANVRLAHFYSDLNDSSFTDVAVKTVKLHISFSSIQKEIEIMEECDHPNIVKFVGWLQEGSYTHIVTEFMHGGNLHNYLLNDKNSPTIGQLFSYILQILDGMIYLGKVHILHRDLAARNCLLNSTHECLKISDFGLSRKTDNNNEYVLQNDSELPFRWLPIESFCGKESYSTKTDVWAFGVVIWEIFERGRVPYKGMNSHGVADFLKSGKRLEQPFYCKMKCKF